MKHVRVSVSETTFESLRAKAKAAGTPGIAAYLLSVAGELTPDAEARGIVRMATARALKRRASDGRFLLKKLFKPEEWENFSKPARLAAGREFLDAVAMGLVDGISIGEKTSSNHQTYERDE